MSVKSKGAKAYIEECQQDGFTHIADALKAIEFAESDAEQRDRERAVRACKLSCPHHRNVTFDNNYKAGNCTVAEFINGEKTCDELFDGKYCKVSEFLKHYDNQ